MSDPKKVFICVNGILTRPGAHDDWTDRAVTHLNKETPYKAEKWEYAASALTRRLKQQSRAEKIAVMIGYYQRAGFDVALIGHSNGCDIIARVLALREEPWAYRDPIESAHLFAPAADAADFHQALMSADVARVFIYGSANDKALQLGAVSRSMFGWAGLGYGSLGRMGADVEQLRLDWHGRVKTVRVDDYGHSTWWDDEYFEMTMATIIAQDASPISQ